VAQGGVPFPAIGHAHACHQGIATDVHRRTTAIEQPAPTATAVFLAGAVAPHGDAAGAADHQDAGPVREGPAQGRALITGYSHSPGR
jgi:hypothetical protein